MKITITGASGLVGHAAAQACLRRGHTVTALYHNRRPLLPESVRCMKMDLADAEALVPLLLEDFPDVIINAAAVSNPADVEADPRLAQKLNVTLPRRLAEVANHLSARLYHLSTDMVFDGQEGNYRSTDVPLPMNTYGQLKLLAEKEVLKAGGDFVTVLRICIVNGNSPSGERSIHEKLFAAWARGEKARLYTDEQRQPVSAENLGDVLAELAERPNLHGIFHWAGADVLSRYEMGLQIARHFKLPEDWVVPVAQDAAAPRPAKLTLNLEPLVSKLRTQPSLYQTQLEELLVPPQLANWYHEQTGEYPQFSARLVRGRDF